ncbi:hypothetical protein Hdeb2414_s0003g00109121 [Helianthus debilis subsp. tardiflorus]
MRGHNHGWLSLSWSRNQSFFLSFMEVGSSTIVGQDPALISSWKLTVRYYAIFTRMEPHFKFVPL